MIQVRSLSKSYGPQQLFKDVSFILNPGERVGLIGRNGHGKTTLFKILIGEEEQDGGDIVIPRGYTIGHLSQHLTFTESNVVDEACLALRENDDGWVERHRAEEILSGLGFSEAMMMKSPQELSGGFQIRLNLTKVLLSDPNLLLLDEPTNYLDLPSIRWLTKFLRAWPREFMIITHDRDFMDSVTTHTLGIHRGTAKKIAGGTLAFYEQILQEETLYEQTRVNEQKRRKDIEKFVDRFRAKASKARAVQSRVKMLEKMEVRDQLSEIDDLEFQFKAAPFPGKWMMHVNDVRFSYPGSADELLPGISFAVGKRDRIAVIGPNGRGKTTFLNLLAGELTPTSGSVQPQENTKLAYFGQTNINRLPLKKNVVEALMDVHPDHHRGVARNVAGLMMFEGDAALKKISVLSGGERSRVLLGRILLTPCNLLLLDEPTNHLDMQSIDSLVDAIDAFQGAVIIVTHSELILDAVATRLIVFDGDTVVPFEGTYRDFLEREGWSNERDQNRAGGGSEGRKGNRKQRAEQVRLQAPLKKRIASLEEEIVQAETKVKNLEAELCTASASEPTRISSLASTLHQTKESIEKLFAELEKSTKELESL